MHCGISSLSAHATTLLALRTEQERVEPSCSAAFLLWTKLGGVVHAASGWSDQFICIERKHVRDLSADAIVEFRSEVWANSKLCRKKGTESHIHKSITPCMCDLKPPLHSLSTKIKHWFQTFVKITKVIQLQHAILNKLQAWVVLLMLCKQQVGA